MSTGKVLLGALAGIAIGATLGILLAPDKGSATRKKITQKGDDFAEEIGDKFNDFVHSMTRKFEKVKAEASRMAEHGRQVSDEVVEEVNSLKNKG